MNTPVKFVADVAHVREVSLHGTAELAFWKERLARDNLAPAEQDGKAQVLLVAAEMRFWGVRFRELSFSVQVTRPGERPRGDAAFLFHAFNSCRFFAFCERVFFSTPYYYGDVRISTAPPASVRLLKGGEVAFRAEMTAAPNREPSRSGEECWDGPIFLPRRHGKEGPSLVFFARLQGQTRTYPFLQGEDVVTIRPSPGVEVLQTLLDSQFVGQEWAVRDNARHARSKTYKRLEAFGAEG
jgi:hypothetical protein